MQLHQLCKIINMFFFLWTFYCFLFLNIICCTVPFWKEMIMMMIVSVCVCVCMCTCMHMCVCVCARVSHFWTAVLNFHCYLQLLHFFINCFTVGCDQIFAFSVMSCNCCNGEMAPKRIHHYKKWTLSAWVILASSIPSSTKWGQNWTYTAIYFLTV